MGSEIYFSIDEIPRSEYLWSKQESVCDSDWCVCVCVCECTNRITLQTTTRKQATYIYAAFELESCGKLVPKDWRC